MNTEKVNFLDIMQRRYRSEHGVLWEVEKHYTWFIYIVAGAIFLAWLNFPNAENIEVIIRIGCGIGIALSMIGYYIVRREGEFLREDMHMHNLTVEDLKELHKYYSEELLEEAKKDWKRVEKEANKCGFILITSILVNMLFSPFIFIFFNRESSYKLFSCKCLKWAKLNVRDLFQATLLLAAVVFITVIVII